MSDTAKEKARKEREKQRAQERRDRKRQWEDTKRMYKYQWRHEKEQWTKEKKYAQEQAKKEREWQQKMADTAHQREMADLKKAGINPVLTATGGSGASTPQGASADVSSLTDNIGQIFATASDYAQSAAQIAQANREAARANAQAAKANRSSARAVYRRAKKTPSNTSDPSNPSDPSDPTQNTGNDNPESNQAPENIIPMEEWGVEPPSDQLPENTPTQDGNPYNQCLEFIHQNFGNVPVGQIAGIPVNVDTLLFAADLIYCTNPEFFNSLPGKMKEAYNAAASGYKKLNDDTKKLEMNTELQALKDSAELGANLMARFNSRMEREGEMSYFVSRSLSGKKVGVLRNDLEDMINTVKHNIKVRKSYSRG